MKLLVIFLLSTIFLSATPNSPSFYIDEIQNNMPKVIKLKQYSEVLFIGETKKGTTNHITEIKSFAEFQAKYQVISQKDIFSNSVYQYFLNGGKKLFILRVLSMNMHDLKKAFGIASKISSIDIVAIPGITNSKIINFGVNFSKRHNSIFIADLDMQNAETEGIRSSSNALLFYPWVKAKNLNNSHAIQLPPSAFVSALFSKNKIYKTPAGKNAILQSALTSTKKLSKVQIKTLSKNFINPLVLYNKKVIIWGSNTFTTQNDREFRYINVKRTYLMIEKSIKEYLALYVKQKNNAKLWNELKPALNNFLNSLWRKGALQGQTPPEAFYVKVGHDNMTQQDINNNLVKIEIGLALLRSTNFMPMQITQKNSKSLR